MQRRQFLGILGGAALWPFAARSQGMAAPVVGFLSPSSNSAGYVEGLFAGLRELGYVDGRNIRIESRWADGKLDQLPKLAAELVRLNVSVLVAPGVMTIVRVIESAESPRGNASVTVTGEVSLSADRSVALIS